MRQYAREQEVTIKQYTRPVPVDDLWEVSATTYQVFVLPEDLKENPTGITLCDGITTVNVRYFVKDGLIQEHYEAADGTLFSQGLTSHSINFMEKNLELVSCSTASNWEVTPDKKGIRIQVAEGFASRNTLEELDKMEASYKIPILD